MAVMRANNPNLYKKGMTMAGTHKGKKCCGGKKPGCCMGKKGGGK